MRNLEIQLCEVFDFGEFPSAMVWLKGVSAFLYVAFISSYPMCNVFESAHFVFRDQHLALIGGRHARWLTSRFVSLTGLGRD